MAGREEQWLRTAQLGDVGEAGVERLRGAHVLVVGAGGLGSAVLPLLVAQGVRRLAVYEHDVVSASNLARQTLYTPGDVGRRKMDVVAERLLQLHPGLELIGIHERFDDLYLGGRPDVVLDCTDNFPSRFMIDDFCRRNGSPLVWGAVEEYVGQVAVLHGASGVGLRDLFPQPEEAIPLPKGIFPPLVHMVGSMMVGEAMKILLGREDALDGTLLELDARTYALRRFDFS